MKTEISVEWISLAKNALFRLQSTLPESMSLIKALNYCSIAKNYPKLSIDLQKIGVFGQLIAGNYIIQNGDRIEFYQDLIQDPKLRRKQLAANKATKQS